jgi:ABC-type sugar transport system permease subunit
MKRTKTKTRSINRQEEHDAWILILPLIILMLLFTALPVLSNFVYSFTDWNGISKPEFVGLKNFIYMFHDERFFSSLKNLGVLILYIPFGVMIPVIIAAAMRDGFKGWRIYRGILYLPNILGPVLLGTLFAVILSQLGPVNEILKQLGFANADKFYLLGKTGSARNVMAFLFVIWMRLGFGCIYFLSAMSNIDPELYDAADVDGANWFQKFIHVTIPGISYALQFFTVLTFIEVFARMYGLIFTLTHGGPGYATYTLEYGIYTISFKGMQKGYASAWSVVLFLSCAVIALIQIHLVKKDEVK